MKPGDRCYVRATYVEPYDTHEGEERHIVEVGICDLDVDGIRSADLLPADDVDLAMALLEVVREASDGASAQGIGSPQQWRRVGAHLLTVAAERADAATTWEAGR